MMQLYSFDHDETGPVKTGCCGYRATLTYWVATSRERARAEIEANTPDEREPHGLCPHCMVDWLEEEGAAISGVEQ